MAVLAGKGERGEDARHTVVRTEKSSRHTLWPSAPASQLLPTPADGCRRNACLCSDLLACPALAAQAFDLCNHRLRRRSAQWKWPGRAVLQARQSFAQIVLSPLSDSPRADVRGFGNGLQRLPALGLPNNSLSTTRRQPGIFMNVHLVLRESLKLRNLSFPGPDRMDNLLKAHRRRPRCSYRLLLLAWATGSRCGASTPSSKDYCCQQKTPAHGKAFQRQL